MRVLLLTKVDNGGAAWFLREALNANGHEARQVRFRESDYIGFPADLIQPDAAKLRALWSWADVIHVHDNAPFVPDAWWREGKPVVVTYHGTMYRDNPAKYDAEAHERGWLQTVATPDLTNLCPRWLPDTRPDYAPAGPYHGGEFRVCHAPTNRNRKGTDAVIRACKGLANVTLDVVESASHAACLERKRRAHLVVDQLTLGYGCNAIEAWQMGLPVISGAPADTLARVRAAVGFLPFALATNEIDIAGHILTLRDNPALYAGAVAVGSQCAERFHFYRAAAGIAVKWYEAAQRQPPWPRAGTDGHGLMLMRYIGGNMGKVPFTGSVTGLGYWFSAKEAVKYVDARDVPGLLAATVRRRDKMIPEFEIVK